MKYGIRKPSLRKSISARTTGRAKRAVKRALIPGYGKKGTGILKNPRKALYNKVYHKTTFSIFDYSRALRPHFRGFYLAAKANVYSRKENWSCISKKEMGNSDIFKIIKTR